MKHLIVAMRTAAWEMELFLKALEGGKILVHRANVGNQPGNAAQLFFAAWARASIHTAFQNDEPDKPSRHKRFCEKLKLSCNFFIDTFRQVR
jgi:hypothetical protein